MKESAKPELSEKAVKDVTHILQTDHLDGPEAASLLLPLVYDELRHLAAYRLAQERPGQTLQATALVNEAYLRLVKNPNMHWENKRHFFNAAAEAMRRILIDSARKKQSQKRGGEWRRTAMDVSAAGSPCPSDEILEVHEVLDQFALVDPQSAELVKLRFFAGLTQQQCAEILGISRRTADKRWAYARAWLARAIQNDP